MANANKGPVSQLGRERTPVFGSFAPNGASAVSADSRKGLGWTVARTSAGLFTVTFTDKWVDLESVTATVQLATGDDKYCQIGTFTASTSTSAATLTIRVWDVSAAAETDVAADTNNRINFCCWFLDTKTGPRRG
jgi:hypothetical protein